MEQPLDLHSALGRIEERLEAIDRRLESLANGRRKSMEWIAQLSQQIGSLDTFREEVRASLEPLFTKIEGLEDNLRILRHATSDVSRRVEQIDGTRRKKLTAG